jgi:hypothetical protein
MSRSRLTLRTFLIGAIAIAWLSILAAAPTRAEDTCVAAAPDEPDAVRGITWTGTVVGIQKRRVDADGIEHWTIEFAVDHVFTHDPDRDFPKGAILAPGLPFTLPNATCGRSPGDLGLLVGHRYLVTAGFIADGGIAVSNLAIWELDGERASIVPGLYPSGLASADITGVRTLAEALALLGIAQPQPTEPPILAAPGSPVDWTVPFALAAVIAVAGLAAVGVRRRRAA